MRCEIEKRNNIRESLSAFEVRLPEILAPPGSDRIESSPDFFLGVPADSEAGPDGTRLMGRRLIVVGITSDALASGSLASDWFPSVTDDAKQDERLLFTDFSK